MAASPIGDAPSMGSRWEKRRNLSAQENAAESVFYQYFARECKRSIPDINAEVQGRE